MSSDTVLLSRVERGHCWNRTLSRYHKGLSRQGPLMSKVDSLRPEDVPLRLIDGPFTPTKGVMMLKKSLKPTQDELRPAEVLSRPRVTFWYSRPKGHSSVTYMQHLYTSIQCKCGTIVTCRLNVLYVWPNFAKDNVWASIGAWQWPKILAGFWNCGSRRILKSVRELHGIYPGGECKCHLSVGADNQAPPVIPNSPWGVYNPYEKKQIGYASRNCQAWQLFFYNRSVPEVQNSKWPCRARCILISKYRSYLREKAFQVTFTIFHSNASKNNT